MIQRIALAIIVGALIGLGLLALAVLLDIIGIPPAEAFAGFLRTWAWVIGVLIGLYYFLSGSFPVKF